MTARRWRTHRPRFYRYVVAFPGVRTGPNHYGWRVIGWYVVVGRWAYCVKWSGMQSGGQEG